MMGVQAISDDVKVVPVQHGRYLDGTDKAQSTAAHCLLDWEDVGDGIVICDGKEADTGPSDAADELPRRPTSVGSRGVDMQIDF